MRIVIMLVFISSCFSTKLNYNDNYTPIGINSKIVFEKETMQLFLSVEEQKTLYAIGYLKNIGNDVYTFNRYLCSNNDNLLIETPFIFTLSDDEIFKIWYKDCIIGYVYSIDDDFGILEYVNYSHTNNDDCNNRL